MLQTLLAGEEVNRVCNVTNSASGGGVNHDLLCLLLFSPDMFAEYIRAHLRGFFNERYLSLIFYSQTQGHVSRDVNLRAS